MIRNKDFKNAESIIDILSLSSNKLPAYLLNLICLISQDKEDEAIVISKKLIKLNIEDNLFAQTITEILAQIWDTHKDVEELDNIISTLNSNQTRIKELFILARIKSLWQFNKNEAYTYYLKYPKLKLQLLELLPELNKYGLQLLTKFINENQKHSKSNKFYHEVDNSTILKECNKIIENLNLEELDDIILSADQIQDIIYNINSGPILVARKNLLTKESKFTENKVLFDVLYYTINGSSYVLDYTRSFIGDDTEESSSNIPSEVRNNYNNIYNNRPYLGLPRTIKIAHEIKAHDTTLIDNYAWMQYEHKYKDIIDAYIDDENNYAETYFASQQDNIDLLTEEMKSRINLERTSKIASTNNYNYYVSYLQDKGLPIYYRVSLDSNFDHTRAEIFLDFNKINAEKPFVSMSGVFISDQHNLLAYGIDYTGNEDLEVRVIDLESLEYKQDIIYNVNIDSCQYEPYNLIWHQKIAGFLYYDNAQKRVRFHRIGEEQDKDLAIEIQNSNKLYLLDTSSNEYAVLSNNHQLSKNAVYLVSLLDDTFQAKLVISNYEDLHYTIDHSGDYVYARVNDTGNNFRIIRAKLDELGTNDCWEEFISHDKENYIKSFSISKSFLILNLFRNGLAEVEVIRLSDKKTQRASFLKEAYNAYGRVTSFENDSISIYYSSFLDNYTTYSYNFDKNEVSVKHSQSAGINRQEYEIKKVWAVNNGTRIPISLFYKKSLVKMDKTNPLYLYGYGAYGINCIDGPYGSTILSLVDRGFIYAIAHIRGGDELGYDWWNNGRGLKTRNRFEDFIACAEYLIKEKYTAYGKIVARGGSSGGLLVAATANMRPDLFKAIIPSNPDVDFLNSMLDTKSLNNCQVYNYGNPKDKEYFDNMLSYCPYMNIKDGPYPSVYIKNGLNDKRVSYYEPLKFVAKLREHKSNDSPILIRTKSDRGHFYPSDRFSRINDIAEEYAFVFKEFGIEINSKPDAVYKASKYQNNFLYASSKFKQAIAMFDKIVKAPDNAYIYNNKGLDLYGLGKYNDAIKMYDKALEIDDQNIHAYNNKGLVFKAMGNIEKAIVMYDKAIELNSKFASAYNNKGNALDELGKNEESIKLYDKAIEIDPKYEIAYLSKGFALKELGKHNEAIDVYNKIIEINPECAKAYYNNGLLLQSLGNIKQAKEMLNKAKKLARTIREN